ncbi:MAG: hypothetical protein KatS3mg097_538 [Candidatus Parcubacteria bacterium]|nr:MAG: hypothetical protein KatS3mg097_538 [Candidatus Parcubacteria bacterium]
MQNIFFSFILLGAIFNITAITTNNLDSFLTPKIIILNFNNRDPQNSILTETNKVLQPKINENRVFEVDLTDNKIYFFENGELKKTIPIAYQAPYGKWYQTPAGYFRIGVKKEKLFSSLFPVYMNYAVQMYEDFFIHEIPYYLDGRRVNSNFTGGCIRLEDKYAQEFFKLAKAGDLVISYLTFKNFKIKEGFHQPVNIKEFFIRQKFNNPLRTTYTYSKDRENDYIQHAGIDIAPLPSAKDLNVYSIADGKVVKIIKNGEKDHGLGNTVIVEITRTNANNYNERELMQTENNATRTDANNYNNREPVRTRYQEFAFENDFRKSSREGSQEFTSEKLYALYGHMAEINPKIKEEDFIKAGQILGKVGATGFGCNYWRIGEDGCDKETPLDTHLHLEIKTKPVLETPVPAKCNIKGQKVKCYGYAPHSPQNYGYIDPLIFLFEKIR